MGIDKRCSFVGVKSIALKSTFARLREMEEKGLPTIDQFGPVLREEIKTATEAGRKLIADGACQLDNPTTPSEAVDVFTEAIKE